MTNGKGGETSANDVIAALDGFVSLAQPVEETAVIELLHSAKVTPNQLKHVLQLCERGKQMCLSHHVEAGSYVAIIEYVRMRLGNHIS